MVEGDAVVLIDLVLKIISINISNEGFKGKRNITERDVSRYL